MTNPAAGSLTRPVLCLLCHPDDEFAIFAEIEAMVSARRRVVCVYLTDGAFGGQSAERRVKESRRGLSRLGVDTDDMHFLGCELQIDDTKLYQRMDDAVEAVRGLVDTIDPSRVLMPAWEGGHPDHDAAHLIGLLVAPHIEELELLQFSLYHGRGLPWILFRVMSPIPENGEVIRRKVSMRDRVRHLGLYRLYGSQWKTWAALYPLILANYVFVGAQRLQLVEPTRVHHPPHPGTLLYERRRFLTWTDFAAATRDLRATIA